ncbi:MAG: rRNA maturation RNase YbeY [Candidatus Staskawiczbacteria bacterium]|nr:rRNA maturation RNase YbeY [Candidatus Staskawiczbacteria bacterium]
MIEINNLTKFSVDKKSFSQVAKKVLLGENRETETLSLAFVEKAEIAKLNKKYRGKNKPTDVLSFLFNEKDYLGEIVICPEVVKEKKEKIMEVFVHGILHLCGYDHEKSRAEEIKMQEKEEKYLEILNF